MLKTSMKNTLEHPSRTQRMTWENESKLPWHRNTQFYDNVINMSVLLEIKAILIKIPTKFIAVYVLTSVLLCANCRQKIVIK